MTDQQTQALIGILHDLLNGKWGTLSDTNRNAIIKELRDVKLETLFPNIE